MNLASAVSVVVLAAAPALAKGPESALSQLKAAVRPAHVVTVASGKPAEAPKPQPKATRFVTVSGPITLSGTGTVSGGWVMVTLSGWGRVQDIGSGVSSDSAYVTTTASLMVSNGWVNGTVWPNAYVSLYKGGKYVGQANVSGTVFVSGFASGSWVNVSGSGTLSGSGQIND